MYASINSAVLLLATTAVAITTSKNGFDPSKSQHPPGRYMVADVATMGNSTFTQLIDHTNPSLGTFEQFYYYSSEFWAGPGSPVVFWSPGEVAADGFQVYLSTNTTPGVIAQQLGAAAVVVEHRYWGQSSPVPDLTTENMKYLTLNQSIADFVNFAENVQLPFDTNQSSVASKAPWVMTGGSYSGALAAWTESTSPDTFWAYLASSAPVQAISDYWGYFTPVMEGMPANCSADIQAVVQHVDSVLTNGTDSDKASLKALFGAELVMHDTDFASLVQSPVFLWQSNQFYYNGGFFGFCDAVEGVTSDSTTLPGAGGIGVDKALPNYAAYVNNTLAPGICDGYGDWFTGNLSLECLDTHNASNPIFTNTSVDNLGNRQWTWMLCNEPFGYWQDAAPAGTPSLVSSLIDVDYFTRQCALSFPTAPDGFTYGLARGATEDAENVHTGGWNINNSSRLIYANGGYDPWRESGVSSSQRPGGPLNSTEQIPVNVVPGGFHTSDLLTRNGAANAGCKDVIDREVAQIVAWVKEWPGSTP